jgi:Asp-tRNA(Asn)/Glu-tRNA(Gln) amidotransferase A subunit family amidase
VDSNLGPQDDKALPGFRVSSSGFLSVNAGLYGSAQGAARKWDQRFESALLHRRVGCEPDSVTAAQRTRRPRSGYPLQLLSSPLSEIDARVRDRIAAAVTAIQAAGASVDEEARAPLGDAEQHRLFTLLLRAATASRIDEGDTSFRATVARGATLGHRAWGIANVEARTKLRYAWQEFFQRYDVLLTPVAATAAFLHDHNPDRDRRLIAVNGRQVPYGDQRFWAGVPSLSYLPATAAPVGLTAAGLPVGVQIYRR